jgi:hypothetical protein
MLYKEVTEMNYKQKKISREPSAPAKTSLFNQHFGICGHAVNVLAEHADDRKIILKQFYNGVK